jgi:hydrogenase-4 component B
MIQQRLFLWSILFYIAGALMSLIMKRNDKVSNYASSAGALLAACAGMASSLPVIVSGKGFVLELPGFLPFGTFGIQVDLLAGFMLLVISLLTAATAIYSLAYQEEYFGKGVAILGFLNNIFIASMALVVTCANAFYFLVLWELMTLVSYFLVCFEQKNDEAVHAGFIYLVVAHAGAALIMVSFILFFLQTGTFDFTAFRTANLPPLTKDLAFLLAFIGFGAKAGVMPLHVWLPRAHPAAPSNVSALMSGVMIKTAIYGIVRVGVDFLGASVWWWGVTVLAFGAISAVLGMLYAMSETDLKRQLAYSSIENIGIILMGIGVGMIGIATRQPVLAVLGILAGLYHLLNHAVFKGLLFLGAGSVIYRIHTKNMEEMGGLVRLMPWTGFAFLVGTLAISAIPPLNGFVSEWFLYQSLFTASTSSILVIKVLSPLCAVMLALTGALAAMCFVKAYGAAFAGPQRSDRVLQAREVPAPMLIGMVTLAISCIGLGIGSPIVAPYVGDVASELLGISQVRVGEGLLVFPGDAAQATLSTPLMAVLFMVLVVCLLAIVWIQGRGQAGRRVDSEPWACGYAYTSRMAYTATAFAQPLQVLFRWAYSLRGALLAVGHVIASCSKPALAYIERMDAMWERRVYGPVARGAFRLGERVQVIQAGNVRLYCMYIIITLIVVLVTTAK